MNAPDVSWLIQRDSHQPVLALRTQRNAVCHAGRGTRSPRKFVEQNWQARFQWLAEAHATALGVYHQSMAVLAERNRRIQAGQAKKDLRPNPGAAPCSFKRFRTRAHIPTLFRLYVSHSPAAAQGRNQSNHHNGSDDAHVARTPRPWSFVLKPSSRSPALSPAGREPAPSEAEGDLVRSILSPVSVGASLF